MISFKKYIKNNMIKVLYEDISLYQTLYDVSEELSKKMYCDKLGSCVHFAEEFVLKIKNYNPNLLKEFFVVEGYVDWQHGDGIPQQHTWIELKDGTKIDPTYEQFTKYGWANYSNKKQKKYTGLQYYLETIKGTWFTERRKKYRDQYFKN